MRLGPEGHVLYFSRRVLPAQPGYWGRPQQIPVDQSLDTRNLHTFHNGPQNGFKDIYRIDLAPLPAFQAATR
ncbi:hypothetical protein [Acanthopleuribacter pedis]|uniref:Uncharacterized protein n=1 Tax=Acanthopleuribacter pedis TaxID=442870 RepID=A0A8J7U2C3_9BACT|nr:hypothetical protein [Acanthopleuribacter pedis]MBO1319158.1 hypothetical protein [Acanthopleuribacter pedis]